MALSRPSAALRMLDTSTPSMMKAFSDPLAPLTEYPPTPPPGLLPDVPVTPPPTLPALVSNTTPGAYCRIVLNVRPLGVFSMIFSVMLVADLLEVTSMVSPPEVIVTDSETLPAGTSKSTLVVFPKPTITFSFFTVLKPWWLTDNTYVPTGAFGKL